MHLHGAPLGLCALPALVGVHLVLRRRLPAAAHFHTEDRGAFAVLVRAVAVLGGDGIVPGERTAFCGPDDDGPPTADPLPRLAGRLVLREQVPEVVLLLDRRTARRLSCLDQKFYFRSSSSHRCYCQVLR